LPGSTVAKTTLLLLVAEHEDRLGEEPVGGEEVADAQAAVRELLLDDAPGEAVGHAAAPELLGQHERGQPDGRGAVPDVPRHLRSRDDS
jgi:hypothetical protein